MFGRFDQRGAEHIVMQVVSRRRRLKIVPINPSSGEVAATHRRTPLNIHGRHREGAPVGSD